MRWQMHLGPGNVGSHPGRTTCTKPTPYCGGQSRVAVSTIIYSITETAKENGLNRFKYLTWLLENYPALADRNDPGALERLSPWSEAVPQAYRLRT